MSDIRYPWERDPLIEPPHTQNRFDDNRAEIESLRAALEIATKALKETGRVGVRLETIDPNCRDDAGVAREALAAIEEKVTRAKGGE